ncbi:MAG: peptide chain release factor-like protein [Candidatus Gracilibacteria bacterium]|jgi:protein subunit release factor B
MELSAEFLQKAEKLGIKSCDVEEKFVRGSGAGGQKINKTSSCVWLKHLPTGTEVKCQQYREREKNRAHAYKLLISKIEQAVSWRDSKKAKAVYKIRKQKQRRSKRAKEKMLEGKRRRAEVKMTRKDLVG